MSSARALGLGAAGLGLLYAGSNCIFNVESGHRGIVFNRLGGIKDAVCFNWEYLAGLAVAGDRLSKCHGVPRRLDSDGLLSATIPQPRRGYATNFSRSKM